MLLGGGGQAPPGRLVPPDQWSRCLRSTDSLPKLQRTRSVPRSAEKKKTPSYALPCIKKKTKSAGRKSPSPTRRSPTMKLLPARLRSRASDSSDGRVKLKAKAWSTPPRNRRKSQQTSLKPATPPSCPPAPSPTPSTRSPSSPLAPLICSKRPPHIFSSPASPLLPSSPSLLSPKAALPTSSALIFSKEDKVKKTLPQPFEDRPDVEEGTLGLMILLCGLVKDISEEKKRRKALQRRRPTLEPLPRIPSSSFSFPQRSLLTSPRRRPRLCNDCLAKLHQASVRGSS